MRRQNPDQTGFSQCGDVTGHDVLRHRQIDLQFRSGQIGNETKEMLEFSSRLVDPIHLRISRCALAVGWRNVRIDRDHLVGQPKQFLVTAFCEGAHSNARQVER